MWWLTFEMFRPSALPQPPGGHRSTAYSTLRSLTLTCHLFRDLAQGILFDCLVLKFYHVINYRSGAAECKEKWSQRTQGMLEMLKSREECRRWIQNLDLQGPTFEKWSRQTIRDDWTPAEQMIRLLHGLKMIKLQVCYLSLDTILHVCHLPNLRRLTLELTGRTLYPSEAGLATLPPPTSLSLTDLIIHHQPHADYSDLAPLVAFLCRSSVTSLEASSGILSRVLCKNPGDATSFSHLRSLTITIDNMPPLSEITAILGSSPYIRKLRVVGQFQYINRIPWEELTVLTPSRLPLEEIEGNLAFTRRFILGRPVAKVTVTLMPGPEVDPNYLTQGTVPVRSLEINSVKWRAPEFRLLSSLLPALEELKLSFRSDLGPPVSNANAGCYWYWDAMEELAGDVDVSWPALRNLELRLATNLLWLSHHRPFAPPGADIRIKLLAELKNQFKILETAAIDNIPYRFEGTEAIPQWII